MPQKGITLGPDCSLTIRDINGDIILNQVIQDFESKPEVEKRKVLFLDGNSVPVSFQQGYSGTFNIVREGPDLDNYFTLKETLYYNKTEIPSVIITQSITESDGSITQFQFIEVDLTLDDAGKFMNNQEVIQSVSWEAKRRLKLS